MSAREHGFWLWVALWRPLIWLGALIGWRSRRDAVWAVYVAALWMLPRGHELRVLFGVDDDDDDDDGMPGRAIIESTKRGAA